MKKLVFLLSVALFGQGASNYLRIIPQRSALGAPTAPGRICWDDQGAVGAVHRTCLVGSTLLLGANQSQPAVSSALEPFSTTWTLTGNVQTLKIAEPPGGSDLTPFDHFFQVYASTFSGSAATLFFKDDSGNIVAQWLAGSPALFTWGGTHAPGSDDAYDLGTTSAAWRAVYVYHLAVGPGRTTIAPALTGTRFVCIDASGNLVSSPSACSGT